ncbi:PREDICTED: E3 ubiquitin-protein ligase RNF115-like isoform X2 [Habropoda laboriosa]|uniref:E3 ubiquitin-protein ligase RNF115-like isoform X2 n=1 Tax=Habropoda laboriosa TaxID=597456 RepID=UPI00083DF192|nr:PREDICTED: E3 ubiquitin-protein ligase RNF115-like isoform X2 [Habropoda laboriosa]
MAEAVVDGTPMSRFFCHKCSIEIERLLPDYTCPRCASGFIEELESDNNDMVIPGTGIHISTDSDDSRLLDEFWQRYIEIEIDPPNRNNGPTRYRMTPHARDNLNRRPTSRQEDVDVQNFMRDFARTFTDVDVGQTVTQVGQLPVLFLGNPGDYVWGQDGLDAIVTQFLNHVDGAGPPPLPRKQIDEIPTTTVAQDHVDRKLQCSVCWEDFKLSEPVKQLPCQHLYHALCIIPWLELHGTCPICRKDLGDPNSAEINTDTVGRSLVALFRAANESNNSRTPTPSSSGNNTSSNTSASIGNNSGSNTSSSSGNNSGSNSSSEISD